MRLPVFAALLCFTLSIPAFAVEELTPSAAYAQSRAGNIIIVDIRRPDEWEATGVAQGARTLDMRRDDFMSEIKALAAANPGKKIALICQAGVRSARMSRALEDAGLNGLVDVTGGTSEWLELGLPVRK